jgi:hypothetical protein
LVNKKKITITVETDSILLVRRGRNSMRPWCAMCNAFTELASLEEASVLTSFDAATLTQLIKAKKLHPIEAPDGLRLVCFLSILRQMPKA